MKNILLLAVLLYGINAKAQDSIKGNQYHLKARIINTLDLPGPDCGYFAFATVIEFEIIKFSDSAYSLKNVPIIFTCPEFYGKDFFKVGMIYNIKLADENQAQFGWTIINKGVLNKYDCKKEFWAIDAKKN